MAFLRPTAPRFSTAASAITTPPVDLVSSARWLDFPPLRLVDERRSAVTGRVLTGDQRQVASGPYTWWGVGVTTTRWDLYKLKRHLPYHFFDPTHRYGLRQSVLPGLSCLKPILRVAGISAGTHRHRNPGRDFSMPRFIHLDHRARFAVDFVLTGRCDLVGSLGCPRVLHRQPTRRAFGARTGTTRWTLVGCRPSLPGRARAASMPSFRVAHGQAIDPYQGRLVKAADPPCLFPGPSLTPTLIPS